MLISRMQANADQVERDILETQKRLQQVRPEGQMARHGDMGGPLSCPGVPTDHGEGGADDFCPSLSTFQTQWKEGSAFFLLGSYLGGSEGLEGGPGLPCVLEPGPYMSRACPSVDVGAKVGQCSQGPLGMLRGQ